MKHLINKGKALVICGPQGSGKTLIAKALASALGTYYITFQTEMKNLFSMSGIVENNPDTIIVEEFTDWALAKQLVSNNKLKIERRMKEPVLIDTPNFIFISNSPSLPPLDRNDERFMVIEIH